MKGRAGAPRPPAGFRPAQSAAAYEGCSPRLLENQFDAVFDAEEDTLMFHRIKRKSNWLEVWKKCPIPMDDLPP